MTTPQPERDQSVDRLLRRAMRAGTVPEASEHCLDAETAAAWIDGALPADAAAAVEAHASACARCQSMLAALVRASPPLPRPEPWWRRRWIVAGLVPLTAGAAAIAIWVAVPKDADRISPALRHEEAPPPAATPAPSPFATAVPPAPATAPEPPFRVDRFEKPAEREKRAPAAPPPERQQQKADARFRDEQAAPKATADPGAAASAAGAANDAVSQLRMRSAVVDVTSPDGSIRWRVGASGAVQRSSDGGATWEMVASGATEDLTAASAPSATVCWIAGRGGAVLLSTNGRDWQRVAFPERIDLAAIQATDSRTATVSTTDGRTFRTVDGGRTWSRMQEF